MNQGLRWLKRIHGYSRHSFRRLAGLAQSQPKLSLLEADPTFAEWHERFQIAFEDYEPGVLDGMARALDHQPELAYSPQRCRTLAARFAALYVVAIGQMARGDLPLNWLAPWIAPESVGVMARRTWVYLSWLTSQNPDEQRRPLHFFYAAASEVFRRLGAQVIETVMERSEETAGPSVLAHAA